MYGTGTAPGCRCRNVIASHADTSRSGPHGPHGPGRILRCPAFLLGRLVELRAVSGVCPGDGGDGVVGRASCRRKVLAPCRRTHPCRAAGPGGCRIGNVREPCGGRLGCRVRGGQGGTGRSDHRRDHPVARGSEESGPPSGRTQPSAGAGRRSPVHPAVRTVVDRRRLRPRTARTAAGTGIPVGGSFDRAPGACRVPVPEADPFTSRRPAGRMDRRTVRRRVLRPAPGRHLTGGRPRRRGAICGR